MTTDDIDTIATTRREKNSSKKVPVIVPETNISRIYLCLRFLPI